jgi:hypothetical protein
MVAVELACRKQPGIKFLKLDEGANPKRGPLQWKVDFGKGIKCGVIPDQVFGLEFNGKRCWYFLEADRATMPVTRRNADQTSFMRKLLAYEATWARKIRERDLGIQRFRVLTVTTTQKRVRTMIEACRELKQGRGLFLFTEAETLQAQPDFFTIQWQTARDTQTTGLLD